MNNTAHKLMVQIKCDFSQRSIPNVFLKNRTLLEKAQRSLTTDQKSEDLEDLARSLELIVSGFLLGFF